MNTKEHAQLLEIANGDPWKVRGALSEFLAKAEIYEEKKGQRTSAQNAALHVDCKLIADKLNDAGLDIRSTLKESVEVPWTQETVKELIWKPVQRLMFHKESTTELGRWGEINEVHEVIMRELGKNHGIEYHSFPHHEAVQFAQADNLKREDYPEYKGAPTI